MKLVGISTVFLLPLVLGATISDKETNDSSLYSYLKRFQGFSVDDYIEEMSSFFGNMQRVANDALAEYGQENNAENWPNNLDELTEMIFDKADINRAGLFNFSFPWFGDNAETAKPTTSSGTVFTLGGTVYSYAGPTTVGPAPTVYTISGTVFNVHPTSIPTASTSSGGFNIGVPGFSNFFSGILVPAPSASPQKSMVDLKPVNVSQSSSSEALHKLCAGGWFGGLAACVAESFANALDGFNNKLFNLIPLTDLIRFFGKSISDFIRGTIDIDKIVNGFVGLFSSIISGDNPIGFIIRGIATTIYNNPAAPIAGFVNVAQFISKTSNDIIKEFEKFFGGLSEGTKTIISQVVNGVVNQVIDIAHTSTNPGSKTMNATAIGFHAFSREFFAFTDTRAAMVSPDLQKFMNFAQHVGNIAYASDPSLYSVLLNPTDENIRKTVILVAKVIANHKN